GPHLHDRDGRARAARSRNGAREVRGRPEADLERQDVARLQRESARGDVLLRADRGGRRAGVPGHPESDPAVEQVEKRDYGTHRGNAEGTVQTKMVRALFVFSNPPW